MSAVHGGDKGWTRGVGMTADETNATTYHSLSEALHCHDYSNSHMYSVEEIDASAAERRSTLAEEGRR
jgi:hypothetical protein